MSKLEFSSWSRTRTRTRNKRHDRRRHHHRRHHHGDRHRHGKHRNGHGHGHGHERRGNQRQVEIKDKARRSYKQEEGLKTSIPKARLIPRPDAFTLEILKITNSYREHSNQLRLSLTLTLIARQHTYDQAFNVGSICHTGSDGSTLGQRVKRFGYVYKTVAENVASGQLTPQHVCKSWMKSKSHRRNMIRNDVDEMGLWFTHDNNGKLFWTQLFGKLV